MADYMAPYLYVEFKIGDAFQIEMTSDDAVHLAMGRYVDDPCVKDCGLLYMEPGMSTFIDANSVKPLHQPKGIFTLDLETYSSLSSYHIGDLALVRRLHEHFAPAPKLTVLERVLDYLDRLLTYLQTPTAWPTLLRRITTFIFPIYFLLLASTAVTVTLLSKITEFPDWFRLTFVSWDLWWNEGDQFA